MVCGPVLACDEGTFQADSVVHPWCNSKNQRGRTSFYSWANDSDGEIFNHI